MGELYYAKERFTTAARELNTGAGHIQRRLVNVRNELLTLGGGMVPDEIQEAFGALMQRLAGAETLPDAEASEVAGEVLALDAEVAALIRGADATPR